MIKLKKKDITVHLRVLAEQTIHELHGRVTRCNFLKIMLKQNVTNVTWRGWRICRQLLGLCVSVVFCRLSLCWTMFNVAFMGFLWTVILHCEIWKSQERRNGKLGAWQDEFVWYHDLAALLTASVADENLSDWLRAEMFTDEVMD